MFFHLQENQVTVIVDAMEQTNQYLKPTLHNPDIMYILLIIVSTASLIHNQAKIKEVRNNTFSQLNEDTTAKLNSSGVN